ncbi:MAG: hypothetical protein WKG01_13350 [Kofleriaceae bacterium]
MKYLIYLCAVIGLVPGCVGDEDPPVASASQALTTTFTGTIPVNGWATRQITLTATSDVSASLSWASATSNLNLFLSNAAGTSIDFANGAARPEVVDGTALPAGTYTLGIKNKTGPSTAYTLTVTTTPVFHAAYPGQPVPGSVFWGAAISGNGDPITRHETPAGAPLALHRTFWQWNHRATNLVQAARDDLEHARLPWVSVKTPSWAAMGAGTHDAEIDQMLVALDALPGPIWLTIHHEPEGGGGVNQPDDPAGPAGHVAMNRRVRQRITALGVDNVALAPILMSYTFKGASGRNPDEWWAPGIYDFFGVDHYVATESSLIDTAWGAIRTWAAARGVDVAVGEWGMRGTDAAAGARVHAWYDAAIGSATDGRGARVVGLSAFDSNLNSPTGGWELFGQQLSAFRDLLGDPRTASINDE